MALLAGKLRRVQETETDDLAKARTYKTIHPNQAYTVPANIRYMAVLSGTAWMSLNREDLVLQVGQWQRIEAAEQPVVVSALENITLELEMLA